MSARGAGPPCTPRVGGAGAQGTHVCATPAFRCRCPERRGSPRARPARGREAPAPDRGCWVEADARTWCFAERGCRSPGLDTWSAGGGAGGAPGVEVPTLPARRPAWLSPRIVNAARRGSLKRVVIGAGLPPGGDIWLLQACPRGGETHVQIRRGGSPCGDRPPRAARKPRLWLRPVRVSCVQELVRLPGDLLAWP